MGMLQPNDASREQELRLWLRSAGLADGKASYRVDEVCRLLNISLRTAYRMVTDGRIRSVSFETAGKTTYRIPRPFLHDLISSAR